MTPGTCFIVNRLGTVHRLVGTSSCSTAEQAQKRRAVTPVQCFVFHLQRCHSCWPNEDSYLLMVSRKRAS